MELSPELTVYLNNEISQEDIISQQERIKIAIPPSLMSRVRAKMLHLPAPTPDYVTMPGAWRVLPIEVPYSEEFAKEVYDTWGAKIESLCVCDSRIKLLGVMLYQDRGVFKIIYDRFYLQETA